MMENDEIITKAIDKLNSIDANMNRIANGAKNLSDNDLHCIRCTSDDIKYAVSGLSAYLAKQPR